MEADFEAAMAADGAMAVLRKAKADGQATSRGR
jgi:hypothetical protein